MSGFLTVILYVSEVGIVLVGWEGVKRDTGPGFSSRLEDFDIIS
jgi:hypothetical protein